MLRQQHGLARALSPSTDRPTDRPSEQLRLRPHRVEFAEFYNQGYTATCFNVERGDIFLMSGAGGTVTGPEGKEGRKEGGKEGKGGH